MSEQNAIKIVVDTNIWISFLIGRSFDSLINTIATKKVEIFFSRELNNELFTVITRPKLKAQITETKIAEIREVINNIVTIVETDSGISDCRDPGDNFLLELAVSAGADYLITGDSDLLVLNPYRNIHIIKAKEFENILSEI
jgi:putative PIN family toxin of toxin-antitoxin system